MRVLGKVSPTADSVLGRGWLAEGSPSGAGTATDRSLLSRRDRRHASEHLGAIVDGEHTRTEREGCGDARAALDDGCVLEENGFRVL